MNFTRVFIRALRSKNITAENLCEIYSNGSEVRYEVQVACALQHAAIQDLAVFIGDNEMKMINHTEVFTVQDRQEFAQRLESIVSIVRLYKGDYRREMALELARSARRLAYDIQDKIFFVEAPRTEANDPCNYFPIEIIKEYGATTPKLGVFTLAQEAFQTLCKVHTEPHNLVNLDVAKAACVYSAFQQERGFAACLLEPSVN